MNPELTLQGSCRDGYWMALAGLGTIGEEHWLAAVAASAAHYPNLPQRPIDAWQHRGAYLAGAEAAYAAWGPLLATRKSVVARATAEAWARWPAPVRSSAPGEPVVLSAKSPANDLIDLMLKVDGRLMKVETAIRHQANDVDDLIRLRRKVDDLAFEQHTTWVRLQALEKIVGR